jgi:hypothetical protein
MQWVVVCHFESPNIVLKRIHARVTYPCSARNMMQKFSNCLCDQPLKFSHKGVEEYMTVRYDEFARFHKFLLTQRLTPEYQLYTRLNDSSFDHTCQEAICWQSREHKLSVLNVYRWLTNGKHNIGLRNNIRITVHLFNCMAR